MEEASKRNETRKCYIIVHGIKAGFQWKMSDCKDRDNNVIGSDQSIMECWKTWYTKSEEQSENPTDEVWEIIRTLKNNKSPGEGNISAELIKYGDKKLWEEIRALIEVVWT